MGVVKYRYFTIPWCKQQTPEKARAGDLEYDVIISTENDKKVCWYFH